MTTTYAIIETGGKQYRVAPGDVLDVDRVKSAHPGETIQLDRVLMLSVDSAVTVGKPTVAGARVTAKIDSEPLGEKIIVLKYKRKVRYRRKTGHRHHYSRLSIQAIETADGRKFAATPRVAPAPKAEAPAEEAVVEKPAAKAKAPAKRKAAAKAKPARRTAAVKPAPKAAKAKPAPKAAKTKPAPKAAKTKKE